MDKIQRLKIVWPGHRSTKWSVLFTHGSEVDPLDHWVFNPGAAEPLDPAKLLRVPMYGGDRLCDERPCIVGKQFVG